mgnify:CR=1 FL=1
MLFPSLFDLFQPTLPARGATQRLHPARSGHSYFNPRSPHGERHLELQLMQLMMDFNPRSPHGERRRRLRGRSVAFQHFNPRSPHGERRCSALRAAYCHHFNPRSPHGERRHGERRSMQARTFQPTLPARGATIKAGFVRNSSTISTHAPRTGSDCRPKCLRLLLGGISTHAPRTGSDNIAQLIDAVIGISTHAPRTGSDTSRS